MEYDQLQGTIIGGYKLLRVLGSGGNGVVYLARQLAVDRIAACKILHPDLAENPVYIRNFIREARTAASLEHPHVIQALDVGGSDGLYYFAMEYVPGVSLEKIRTTAPERITLPFLLDISISLADALDFAWSRFHIIHGDIKPDNLMIRDRDNVLKLADLGLAHVAGSDDGSGEIMATPLYAAPEVIMGGQLSTGVRSDIYSFGIMLYELLAGKAPFRGSMDDVLRQHVEVDPEPLFAVNPGVDEKLAELVGSMICKAPADRPADWKTVKDALTGIRSGSSDEKVDMSRCSADVDDDEHDRSSSRYVPLILGAVMLLLTLATGYMIYRAMC